MVVEFLRYEDSQKFRTNGRHLLCIIGVQNFSVAKLYSSPNKVFRKLAFVAHLTQTYLCAGVDGVANVKSTRSVKKNSVKQVALAGSIHACYG